MNPLSHMQIGQHGRIVRVEGTDELAMRLLEMGLTPGVEVRVLGTAPLGDPMELSLRGYRLSLRKSEAGRVMMEGLPASSEPATNPARLG